MIQAEDKKWEEDMAALEKERRMIDIAIIFQNKEYRSVSYRAQASD